MARSVCASTRLGVADGLTRRPARRTSRTGPPGPALSTGVPVPSTCSLAARRAPRRAGARPARAPRPRPRRRQHVAPAALRREPSASQALGELARLAVAGQRDAHLPLGVARAARLRGLVLLSRRSCSASRSSSVLGSGAAASSQRSSIGMPAPQRTAPGSGGGDARSTTARACAGRVGGVGVEEHLVASWLTARRPSVAPRVLAQLERVQRAKQLAAPRRRCRPRRETRRARCQCRPNRAIRPGRARAGA